MQATNALHYPIKPTQAPMQAVLPRFLRVFGLFLVSYFCSFSTAAPAMFYTGSGTTLADNLRVKQQVIPAQLLTLNHLEQGNNRKYGLVLRKGIQLTKRDATRANPHQNRRLPMRVPLRTHAHLGNNPVVLNADFAGTEQETETPESSEEDETEDETQEENSISSSRQQAKINYFSSLLAPVPAPCSTGSHLSGGTLYPGIFYPTSQDRCAALCVMRI